MADRTKASRQRADLALRIGDRVEADLRVDVSNSGLLAIGGMVAAILLSVAVLVRAAARNRPSKLIDINYIVDIDHTLKKICTDRT